MSSDRTSDSESARQQAIAQCKGIAEMVAALECDWDRLAELRQAREDYLADGGTLLDWSESEDGAELAELEAAAGEYQDREDAERAIAEDPLSVQVRSGWYQPGLKESDSEAAEFEILLCTGGPAVRIRGELGQYNQPSRAWVEYQDWFTPWTELVARPIETDTLLTYCQQFYFGE